MSVGAARWLAGSSVSGLSCTGANQCATRSAHRAAADEWICGAMTGVCSSSMLTSWWFLWSYDFQASDKQKSLSAAEDKKSQWTCGAAWIPSCLTHWSNPTDPQLRHTHCIGQSSKFRPQHWCCLNAAGMYGHGVIHDTTMSPTHSPLNKADSTAGLRLVTRTGYVQPLRHWSKWENSSMYLTGALLSW